MNLELDSSSKPHNLLHRRGFLKLCATVAAMIGVPAVQVAEALSSDNRPPVIYLNFAGCTGCTEAILRTQDPDFTTLIMDVLNIVYMEPLMAASGEESEALLQSAVQQHRGNFICVVEGAIPAGHFGFIGSHTFLEVAQDILPKAKYVVAFGTCAAYGGLPAAGVNPTGARGVQAATGVNTINLTGCPPHPANLVALIAGFLINNKLPSFRSSSDRRPVFCHGQTVHSQCTTDNGCLLGYKCIGPQSFNNCPSQPYNEESYCIRAGHMCIGCSESGFWDRNAPFYTPEWPKAFAIYRGKIGDHITPENAGCFVTCHKHNKKPNIFQDNLVKETERYFQEKMHNRHNVDLIQARTKVGDKTCGACHVQPDGFGSR
ncbi:hydrogenase small subunit [Desulfonatronum parangueonense]